MLKSYLIVERSALPEYFIKVVEARTLLETGKCTQVNDAVRTVGISRSTYYKYKDKIVEPSRLSIGQKATHMLMLNHESGMLSRVLNTLSAFGANILTITQSIPVHGKANIMLTMDMVELNTPIEHLLNELQNTNGVEKVRLLAIE